MSGLYRFGISLEKTLLDKFDRIVKDKNYGNRSEAFRDLIRQELVKKEWQQNKEIAGAITLIYGHHKRELVNNLTDIQHDYQNLIISTQHIHLDHDNCMEIVMLQGEGRLVKEIAEKMMSLKGVKHVKLATISPNTKL